MVGKELPFFASSSVQDKTTGKFKEIINLQLNNHIIILFFKRETQVHFILSTRVFLERKYYTRE